MLFVSDERGVAEEFTSLPALVVVMIGFGLFFALIAGVYYSYNERVESINKYGTADFVLERLTSEGGILHEKDVIKESGKIDVNEFHRLDNLNQEMVNKKSGLVGVEYGLKLRYKKESLKEINCWLYGDEEVVAASKQVSVYLNEAETVPGILTVVVRSI